MASGRKITIEFLGKDVSAGRTASDLEKKFGKMGGRMDKVGRVSGQILAGGLLLAGGAAIKAGQAAADDEAAQEQLAQQLRKAAGASNEQIAATEDWITAQGKATGISDDVLRPALAKLATATGDVAEAQDLAALAMDVAAGSGKTYEQVTEAMVKAQNGSVGGLGRLGIATKDAEGKTKSFAEIQKDLAGKYMGAAAKAAETTAGKQKILSTQFGELQEKIGAKLLPAMVKLADIGLKVVDWVSNNTTVVGTLVGVIGGLLAVTWATTKAIAVWTALTKIAAAAQIVFTNVQWAFNAAMAANPIGLVVLAVIALVAVLVIAYKKSETFRKIVDAAFGAVADTAKTVFGFFKKVAVAAFDAVSNAVKKVVGFIKSHWKTILAILTGPIGIAVALIIKYWDKIKAGAAAVRDFVAARFAAVKEAIVNAFVKARERADVVWEAIKSGFGAVKDKIVDIASTIRTTVSNAFDAMLRPIQAVIDKVQWLIDKIKSIPTPNIPGLRVSDGGSVSSGGVRTPTITRVPRSVAAPQRARASRGSGGTVSAIVQFVLPGGKVIEEQLIQWSRETGRPLQVRTL